ncbi:serine/threonine protein kinase [Nodosilinea sp. LEGE 06152]|uniref:WD40 repeat domain-containing serine/threonine-protein kinase n=1 Tax=Nodosilinea sp. LEGE 06152 TaxID=2777966 RepID=UPI00187F2702|nr:WD40 repeat domain-containing serine/threonine-protein kinase [Nodosilinea sp. LEGE 06152]MBE9156855.1 serine/threonine protein kinase [Nodosilinea sp. LEGE 06152]
MICCLNPHCTQPNHATLAAVCPTCGTPLEHRLRGRYRPLKLIGRGGFGRTYFALDTDRLNSRCVIKQFAPQTQGTKSFLKAVQLFEQEAVRLHELGEHPQIPTLLAYFEQNKYLYLVQQMVQGRTLHQEISAQAAYSESSLRQLLEDLLPVLYFIHQHGVIHRDITPSNIIRRKIDQKPVLIDFGVAKQFSEAIRYEPGTRIGTEGYAPIEQLRSGQAYPSSDLYSLGATCLHLLTGCKPEDLYSPQEGRWLWQEYLQKQGRTIHPGLAAVLNCMTKDLVSERYQTAQDVLDDLQRLPKLEGTVPGWVSNQSGQSLFAGLDRPPLSGPGQAAGLAMPITSLPPTAETAGPTSKPFPQPTSDSASRPVSGSASSPPASRPTSSSSASRPSSPSSSATPSAKPSSARSSSSGAPGSGPAAGNGWQLLRTLAGHQSWVMAVAFNPQQPVLVSGSLDDTLRFWNWQSGDLLHSLKGHARGVNDVAIDRRGQVLVSCGDDATIKVWNLGDGTLRHTLKGHLRDVTAIAIGSSNLLASASEDGTLKLWSLSQGTLIKTLPGSAGMLKTVALTDADQRLVSGGLDNTVRLWNAQTAQALKVFTGHTNTVNQVAVSPDGRLVASASKDRTVRLWNLTTGDLQHTLQGHTQEVNTVAFFPDGKRLVSGSSDGTLRLWHSQTGAPQETLPAHTNPVHRVAVQGSGGVIASASVDKTIKLWQWRS